MTPRAPALPPPPGWLRWFLTAWRDPGRRRAVAASYGALRERPDLVADIALRGGVYAPSGAQTAVDLARAEGRRELALELIALAGMEPGRLLRLIEIYEPKDFAK